MSASAPIDERRPLLDDERAEGPVEQYGSSDDGTSTPAPEKKNNKFRDIWPLCLGLWTA